MIAIAWHELSSRRLLLVAALLAGVLPLGKTLGHPEAMLAVSGVIALVFAAVSGLAVGAGLIGPELAQRRLSFWFHQPVSGGSIYLGKLLGGAAVVFAGTLLVELPALVLRIGAWRASEAGYGTLLLGGVAVSAIAVGIVLGMELRIVPRWTGIDLALGCTVVWLVVRANQLVDDALPGKQPGAVIDVLKVETIFAGLAVLALLAAGGAAVIVGRTELDRARKALSTTLVVTLAPLAIGLWAWARAFAA